MTFFALLRRFGSPEAAIEALPRLSRPVAPVGRREAVAELAAIERLGGRLLCWGEPLYPALLAAIEDAPPVLTVFGRPELLPKLLGGPIVAVVGARNASANGRRLARELAAGLGAARRAEAAALFGTLTASDRESLTRILTTLRAPAIPEA